MHGFSSAVPQAWVTDGAAATLASLQTPNVPDDALAGYPGCELTVSADVLVNEAGRIVDVGLVSNGSALRSAKDIAAFHTLSCIQLSCCSVDPLGRVDVSTLLRENPSDR